MQLHPGWTARDNYAQGKKRKRRREKPSEAGGKITANKQKQKKTIQIDQLFTHRQPRYQSEKLLKKKKFKFSTPFWKKCFSESFSLDIYFSFCLLLLFNFFKRRLYSWSGETIITPVRPPHFPSFFFFLILISSGFDFCVILTFKKKNNNNYLHFSLADMLFRKFSRRAAILFKCASSRNSDRSIFKIRFYF